MTSENTAAAKKTVWLTFDDGPHPVHTDGILKVLDRFDVKATFFVVGELVEQWGDVVERSFNAGHRIGNHSFAHPDLTKLPEDECRRQILETDRLISRYVGQDRLFRVPYGARNATVDRIVRETGYRMIGWNADTLDWAARYQPRGWIFNGLTAVSQNDDSIVLIHDTCETTAANLDAFLDAVLALGNVDFGRPDRL
jgi:peptidoglycan/xylan/chitin deacetylase (PgdA/CDA1 family)